MPADETGFDNEVYEVKLDDYNGEYGDFPGVAKRQNDLWDLYEANTDEEMKAGGKGTNSTGENLWARLPRITVEHYDWMDATEAEGKNLTDADNDCCDRWTLTGGAGGLRTLYEALLTELATPAWHWYGMGGDDHAYDYWPNGMAMAAQFRDQLIEIGAAEAPEGQDGSPYHTTYIAENLSRVYWLVRLRWEADQARLDPGYHYSGDFDDFLSADGFGSRDILGLRT